MSTDATSNVDLSIVVPTYNEEANLGSLLAEIAEQDASGMRGPLAWEVVVADAGSQDRTRAIAGEYGARVVDGGLPSVGRNRGAAAARGDVLYAFDADVRIGDPRFLVKSYHEFLQRRLDCAGVDNCWYYPGTERTCQRWMMEFACCFTNRHIRRMQRTGHPRAQGPCMIFRREAYTAVGGFDEAIYWGEDSELAKRMVERGFRFRILRSVRIGVSARKPISQGVLRYLWNAARLDGYRESVGEVTSRERYEQITGLGDYFLRG